MDDVIEPEKILGVEAKLAQGQQLKDLDAIVQELVEQ